MNMVKVRQVQTGCRRGQREAREAGQHDLLVGGARHGRGTNSDQGLHRIQRPGTTWMLLLLDEHSLPLLNGWMHMQNISNPILQIWEHHLSIIV